MKKMKSKRKIKLLIFFLSVFIVKADSSCLLFFQKKDPSLSQHAFIYAPHKIVLSWNASLQTHFLHYSVILPATEIGSRSKSRINLEFWVSLLNEKGEEVISKVIPLNLKLSRYVARQCKSRGCAVGEMLPIIPGKFKVMILARYKVSEKITCFERTFTVPSIALPSIVEIFLSYTPKDFNSTKLLKPFVVRMREFRPLIRDFVTTAESTFMVIHFTGLDQRNFKEAKFKIKIYKDEREVSVKNIPLTRNIANTSLLEIPLELLFREPGEYKLDVEFIVDNKKRDKRSMKIYVNRNSEKRPVFLASRKIVTEELPGLFRLLSKQYYNQQEYEKAKKVLSSLKSSWKKDEDFILEAKTLLKLGKPEEALLSLQNLNKPSYEKFMLLGEIFELKGDFEKSEEFYRKALQIKSNSINTLNKLGKLLLRTGKTGEGLELLKKSLSLNPNQPEIETILKTYE